MVFMLFQEAAEKHRRNISKATKLPKFLERIRGLPFFLLSIFHGLFKQNYKLSKHKMCSGTPDRDLTKQKP